MTPEDITRVADALPAAYEITSAVIRDDGTARVEVRNAFGVFTRDDFDEHGIPLAKRVSKRKAYEVAKAYAKAFGEAPT